MTRAVALAAAAMLSACGVPTTPPPRTGVGGPPEIVGTVAGVTVAVVPRATEGRSWIAVWIDAGSRDVEPPQVATLAAWEATQGTGVRARVLPDATELALACDTRALDACMARLAGVLSRREVDRDTLADVMERLRAARRGAHADDARLADRLAVSALLGDERGLDPLGNPEDDPGSAAQAILAYRAAHWGPSRALVVVVGDADEDDVRDSVVAHFGRAPAARAARVERVIVPRVGARAEIGERAHASAAIAVRGSQRGAAIARRVLDEMEEATASVFPMRGGEIVLVRGDDPGRLGEALEYARAMVGEGDDRPVDEDDPDALASRLGASWTARTVGVAPEGGMGIGVIVVGGADGTGDDPDAEERARVERSLAAVAERVVAPETGIIARDRVRGAIVLASDDGARALARRENVGRVAVALAIEAPASAEPASAHGRRALLARLIGRCVASVGEAAEVLEDHAIGVVIEVAPRRALEAIDVVTRCARVPPFDPATVEAERAAAIARLSELDRVMALASLAIAPGAPSVIAPRGTSNSLAAIDARSLSEAWRAIATRERATVAIVGEVDEEVVAQAALLGLRRLPPGERIPAASVGIATDEVIAARAPGEEVDVVIALRDPEPRPRGAEPGVRALATALARDICGGALRPTAIDAAAGAAGAWIAIAVRGPDEAIATIAARMQRARAIAFADHVERATARAIEERALGAASVATLARRLATARPGDEPDPVAGFDAARAVLAAPTRIVVARPAAASWRR